MKPTDTSLAGRCRSRFARLAWVAGVWCTTWTPTLHAQPTGLADLSDQPTRVVQNVPANLMLDLSVEWPTGNVQAYNDEVFNGCPGHDGGFSVCYFTPPERAARANAANASNPLYRATPSLPYIGNFDPFKCYDYDSAHQYFVPTGYTIGYDPLKKPTDQPVTSLASCAGQWSGNFLNWATSQTIDIFRWAMTGGDRVIDTEDLTVVQKARHDGQGGTAQFPIKRIRTLVSTVPGIVPSTVSPYATAELYIDIQGRNISMRSASNSGLSADVQDMQVRVKVCDPLLPETATTCTRYVKPGNATTLDKVIWKPTGLIQENAQSVRFGAMGYLLDGAVARDGGVLRSRMKFVGPDEPRLGGNGTQPNTLREWDPSTGIYVTNPDATDASATNSTYGLGGADRVTRSGVIQFLNGFGRKAGYKSLDPFSELVYESLRYYRNVGPTPEYTHMGLTGGSTGTKVDGFPVITSWDDPLEPPQGFRQATEWCPKNFIVGIADSNTHKDKRLPGNTATDNEPAAQPSNPDTGYNVVTLLNEIIATELTNEGVQLRNSGGGNLTAGSANCCNGSAYLAALAYFANTQDIRPDDARIQTRGKQTVKTYMVDVREAGSWGTGVARSDARRRNQLWVAAKYGGFKDINNNGRLDAGDAIADENRDGSINVRDVWDRNGDLLPDTYFEANTPEALVDGLRGAFRSIRAEIASNAGVGVSTRSVELQTDSGLYRVSYDASNWSGSVAAFRYNGFDAASGDINATRIWEAAERVANQNWDSGRRIVTMRSNLDSEAPVTPGGVPFRWATLSAEQQAALGHSDVLEWVRGRQDLAGYRLRIRRDDATNSIRPAVLGDVIDSEARYVGAPQSKLTDTYNPGYEAFKAARGGRRGVIYVGANDGMLHAIDASIDAGSTTGGTEIFAYVPSFLYKGRSAPDVDGLRALSDIDYVHRNYVNATPWVGDVDFARTDGANASGDWRTVLIGGLGKGGQGYFALDITDPEAFGTEAAAASKVLWEFTDPDMGFSFGAPQVVKTRRWGWAVLLTSGDNNVRAFDSAGRGRGFLYVVDVKTGRLLQKISTGVGTMNAPSGLAQVSAYVPDAADGSVTEVYGGDLYGNVWRWDFRSDTDPVPAPLLFATLRDGAGNVQPVTSGPIVRAAPLTRNRYVFVGTGRLLGQSDLYNTSTQSFYAFRDGTRVKAWTATDKPPAVSFPIERSEMVAQTNLLTPVVRNASRPAGWFYDLANVGERVIVDPVDTDLGKISWLGSIPDSTNPCAPAGGARIYAANFETGQSQLFDPTTIGTTNPVRITAYNPQTGIVGLRLVRVDDNIRAVVTGQYGELKLTQAYVRYLNPRSMNWREVTDAGM
ncbi:MAG: pilus assembly protein [Burkholderiales bacterium]